MEYPRLNNHLLFRALYLGSYAIRLPKWDESDIADCRINRTFWQRQRVGALGPELVRSLTQRRSRRPRWTSVRLPIFIWWWAPAPAGKRQLAKDNTSACESIGGIIINRSWLLEGAFLCVQAAKVDTSPADRGAAADPFLGKCFPAFIHRWWGLIQLHCQQRWEVDAIRQ